MSPGHVLTIIKFRPYSTLARSLHLTRHFEPFKLGPVSHSTLWQSTDHKDLFHKTSGPHTSHSGLTFQTFRSLRTRSKPIGVTAVPKASSYRNPPRNLKFQPLSRADIKIIFNGTLSKDAGNHLLAELHESRKTGRLDEIADISSDNVAAGLAYLRRAYRLDEDAAINTRVDQEIDEELRILHGQQPRGIRSQPAIDKIKALNIERSKLLAKEEAKRDAERDAERRALRLGSQDQISVPEATGPSGQIQPVVRKEPEWVTRYRERATETAMPNLTTWQRIVPSTMFTVFVILTSLGFAMNYSPPSPEARLFPATPPAAASLAVLVGLCSMVFVAWRIPPLWATLNRYFISVPLLPRPTQLFLAALSHQKLGHFLLNIIPLWLIGVRLHDDIGRGQFLALVVSGAVFTTYVSLVGFVLKNVLNVSNLGASGIVMALVGTACTLHEGQTLSFPLLSAEYSAQINSVVILVTLVALEVRGLRKFGLANVELTNHLGHLAGLFYGTAVGSLLRRYDPRWQNVRRESFWQTATVK